MNIDFFTLIGWLGTLMILGGYLGGVMDWIKPTSFLALCLNLLGSTLLVIQLTHLSVWNGVMLNSVWAIIALIGIG